MPIFRVTVIDRHSGAESGVPVRAATSEEAIALAASTGCIVGTATLLSMDYEAASNGAVHPRGATSATLPAAQRPSTPFIARVSLLAYVFPVAFLILGLIVLPTSLSVVGLLIVVPAIYSILLLETTKIEVHHHRITGAYGLLDRQTIDMPVSKFESLSVQRSLTGMLLGYGSVVICGSGGTRMVFPCIGNIDALRKGVDSV